MDMNLSTFLQADVFYIQQRKELAQILFDWQTANRYAVMDTTRTDVAYLAERSGGFWNLMKRVLLRSHRPLHVELVSNAGTALLKFQRSFFFLFSDLEVQSPEGERIGSVHRRFAIIYKKYDLRDSTGNVFARIESPFWKLWNFPVRSAAGLKGAEISKKWQGALKEIFTDADTFRVSFEEGTWDEAQKAVIFAAAISIDFDFFENNQGSSGIFSFLPD